MQYRVFDGTKCTTRAGSNVVVVEPLTGTYTSQEVVGKFENSITEFYDEDTV